MILAFFDSVVPIAFPEEIALSKYNLISLAIGIAISGAVQAAPLAIATYDFTGSTLAATGGSGPSLTAIDPMVLNSFVTDTVFGVTKTVYRFDGSSGSGLQGGLSLKTAGLLTSSAYSVDMIFSFDEDGPSWQRILDASNRTSDAGFYVEPGNKLQIYPVADGPDTWTFGEYHRVSLTSNGADHVTAYLDGVFQFDLLTDVMDFGSYTNPDALLTFFADNTSGPAQTEWVPGKVSLIRLYDTELTETEVGDIGAGGGTVPEPGSLALIALGLLGAAVSRRRRQAC